MSWYTLSTHLKSDLISLPIQKLVRRKKVKLYWVPGVFTQVGIVSGGLDLSQCGTLFPTAIFTNLNEPEVMEFVRTAVTIHPGTYYLPLPITSKQILQASGV